MTAIDIPTNRQDHRTNSEPMFDEHEVIQRLKHHLPSQAALKDFIHHNTLHAFQDRRFFDAIFKASTIFGYQVTLQLSEYRQLYRDGRIRGIVLDRVLVHRKGTQSLLDWKDRMLNRPYDSCRNPRIGRLREQWKERFSFDLNNAVQPLLFRIVCAYLDQGIAIAKFPVVEAGLLDSLRVLERNGFVSFFKTKRARELLFSKELGITSLLNVIVGHKTYFEQYLFDQQFSHQGWSGIASSVENSPESLLDRRCITLYDFIVLELLLEIDALESKFGPDWEPLCSRTTDPPIDLFTEVPPSELQEVLTLWQRAFEWSYYDEVLVGLAKTSSELSRVRSLAPSFQAIFCIDEREESLRRHIEQVDPNCQTFGAPGFFGVEFYFRPENGKFNDKLCPAPVTPKYLIQEIPNGHMRDHDPLYVSKTHGLVTGFLMSLTFGFWAGARIAFNLFRPRMSPAISNAFSHMNDHARFTIESRSIDDRQGGLQIGFTVEEMTARIEGQLRNMGLVNDFAPLIYVLSHGSSSANNPHHGAHDCGACSGRPGSVNARVFAYMANLASVRALLKNRGILLPDGTQFLGALHDTAADEVGYFDEDCLTAENRALHQKNKAAFELALDLNAKERSRRFASIDTRQPLAKIRRAIKERSVSLFEPRPELGHGTNSLCIVGRREMTDGLFLDRRAFLNSYDYRIDPEGKLLAGVMRPLGPVCGGINLEYYFSRVDNYKLGAGTKLPHNVMGLFGVANSSDGDLRPGLPVQMIEVHDPVRLLILVEHFPEVVLKAIQSEPSMYEWFINEWVHCIAVHPETRTYWYFENGKFMPYQPAGLSVEKLQDFHGLVENSIKMKTNQIADATRENLPVYTCQ